MKTEAPSVELHADLGTAQERISSAQRQLEIARTSPAECIQIAGIRSALALLEAACNVLSGLDREFREAHEDAATREQMIAEDERDAYERAMAERADEIRAEG